MRLTLALQNLEHGGGDRWPLLRRRLTRLDEAPDLVLLNEAEGWGQGDGALLRRAETDLGMKALPLPPSRSGLHVAILYQPDTVGDPVAVYADLSEFFVHGVLAATFDVGLPLPLAVCTTHLSPFSPMQALIEAELARWTALKRGSYKYAVIGADFNAPPLYGPAADVDRMTPLDRAARTVVGPGGEILPDTRVAEAFARVGFEDAFALLHMRTGDPQYIARTGQTDRIDRKLVSAHLASAVIAGQLLDTPEKAADHHGVAVTIDTRLAAE